MALHCKIIIGLLLLALVSKNGICATYNPNHEVGAPFIQNLTPKDYKSHSQIIGIAQDHRGVLYFGNYSGVLEYDGSTFRFIRHTISTSQGVYFISKKIIIRYFNKRIEIVQFKKTIIEQAYGVKDKVFVMTTGTNSSNKLFQLVKNRLIPCYLPEVLAKQSVITLLPYLKERLLVITKSCQYYICEPKLMIESLQPSSSQNVCTKLHMETEEIFNEAKQYSTAIEHNGLYYIGIRMYGIAVVDSTGKLVQTIKESHGLISDDTWKLFVDKDKNIWSTYTNGISYIQISSPLSVYSHKSGIDSLVVFSTRLDGMYYASTYKYIYKLLDYSKRIQNTATDFVPIKNIPLAKYFGTIKISNTLFAFPTIDSILHIYKISNSGAKLIYKKDPVSVYPNVA